VLIDLGLRGATLAIGYVVNADNPSALAEFEQLVRALKNELDVNVEPASPADFLPIPRSVMEQSRYVRRHGRLDVYYYHLPSLVLAKAARGFEQDLADAERLIRAGEVAWQDVITTWTRVRKGPSGWLRYEPDEVELRLDLTRQRLGISPA